MVATALSKWLTCAQGNNDSCSLLAAPGLCFHRSDDATTILTPGDILESYIFNYTLFDDGKTLKTIDTLLEMGVVPNMNDGTRNSLDYVLANINSQNFSSRVDVAQKLINAGISIEKSHYEILETLKSKNPELYMEFINKTKIQ